MGLAVEGADRKPLLVRGVLIPGTPQPVTKAVQVKRDRLEATVRIKAQSVTRVMAASQRAVNKQGQHTDTPYSSAKRAT